VRAFWLEPRPKLEEMRASVVNMPSLDDFDFLVITLFSASLADMRRVTRERFAERVARGHFETYESDLDIESVYVRVPPAGGAHLFRAVLFEPANAANTTVFISNVSDGWYTLCNLLSGVVPGRHILARSSIEDDYPGTVFYVLEGGETLRLVAARRDEPSWEFVTEGEPLPFEDVSNYEKPRIAHRLDRVILVQYLRKLGWDLEDPEFWTSRLSAFYITEVHKSGLRRRPDPN